MATIFAFLISSGSKEGTQICTSEWSQGITLTQNVDWCFLLNTTCSKIIMSSVYQKRTQTCYHFRSQSPGKRIPSRFPNGAPMERNSRLQRIFSHLSFGAGIFFLSLAHSVYKMWIKQEPNKLNLWSKLHFEPEKNGEYITCLKYSVPIFVE